jgi:hypothetical protein
MSCGIVAPLHRRDVAMHWNAKNRIDHEALRRLAAVLLTLAAIAESVSRRSAPVRCVVLWLLCRAEARARDFAARAGAGASPAFLTVVSPVCLLGGSGEAARLVQRFRALAAVFLALSRQVPQCLRMPRQGDPASLFANQWNLASPRRRPGARQRWCADTS